MWISFKHVSELFTVSHDTVVALREENAALKAELAAVRSELLSSKVNLDWLRVNYNQVQAERTALMNTRGGIQVPVPQLQPTPGAYLPTVASQTAINRQIPSFDDLTFEDMGDAAAERLGLPTYDK
jgi:hypothetical protein